MNTEKSNTIQSAEPIKETPCSSENCSGVVKDGLCQSCNTEQADVDSFSSWRIKADSFVAAIKQLERREIEVDPGRKIFGVPVVEGSLRDAAEAALRHCAHFATRSEERVALVDEANSVRQKTWF